jgi:hypothetical protein
MTTNAGRPDHHRCTRMREPCDGRYLPSGRSTLARRHALGRSQLKWSRLGSTILPSARRPPRASTLNPSLDVQARH